MGNLSRILCGCAVVAIASTSIAVSPVRAEAAQTSAIRHSICNTQEMRADGRISEDIEFQSGIWRQVDSSKLGYFIASHTGKIISFGEAREYLVSIANRPNETQDPVNMIRDIRDTYRSFQAELLAGQMSDMRVFDAAGRALPVNAAEDRDGPFEYSNLWLFNNEVKIRCKVGDADATSAVTSSGGIDLKKHLRLRGTVDGLTATGNKRKTAEAATVGYSRVRTLKSDGTREQSETVSINAVVGISPIEENLYGFIPYVSYELNQTRKNPPPVLTPPATIRDGDTDVLKLGVVGYAILPVGTDANGQDEDWSTSFDFSLDAAYLFDFAKDTERFRARVTTDIYHQQGLFGLCGLRDYRDWRNSKLWTRCDLQVIADYNILTERGRLINIDKETFGHMGVNAKFSASYGDSSTTGPFFGAQYTRLWRVRGDPMFIPQIKRHEFTLGHRWWSGNDFAIEVSASLVDGENTDSFEDENEISFGVGFIF
jgi:hypothetical protein